MKKIMALAISFLMVTLSQAQGIYNMYGSTTNGGSDDIGTIFKSDFSGNNLQLGHGFAYSSIGSTPQSQPVEYAGSFYGMTASGGLGGLGVIYQWQPGAGNTYTKKIEFNGANGSTPIGTLALNGTTFLGLTAGDGGNPPTLFEWDPATNTLTTKYTFDVFTEGTPVGTLTPQNGKFYGMTVAGGTSPDGTVYVYDPTAGTVTILYSFDGTNISNPNGSLKYNPTTGKFYGMFVQAPANSNGGIFEWDSLAPTIATVDYSFDGAGNGGNPFGSLTLSGSVFYGVTSAGGTGTGSPGILFQWDPTALPASAFTVKVNFDGTNITGPFCDLTADAAGTKFYGTEIGSPNFPNGAIFEWDGSSSTIPGSSCYDVSVFKGNSPYFILTLGSDGLFYGATTAGGGNTTDFNSGIIFSWDASTKTEINKIELNGSLGNHPVGAPMFKSYAFFGTTKLGGANNLGAIYAYDGGSGYSIKYDFDGTNGSRPIGKLIEYNNIFYGVTSTGGANQTGVIFSFDPGSNSYTKLQDFDATNINNVSAGLAIVGSNLYGTTSSSGVNGSIFKYDIAGNTLSTVYSFTGGTDGSQPMGGVVNAGGILYGTTFAGGASSNGTLFSYDPAGAGYAKINDFATAPDGTQPMGTMVAVGTKLFGTTSSGGTNGSGTIFSYDIPTTTYAKLIDAGTNYTFTNNLIVNSSFIYGLGNSGALGNGFVFQLNPVTNALTVESSFTPGGADGSLTSNVGGGDIAISAAPVANEHIGACSADVPDITIDATNNNVWVPIVDGVGNAIAEIKANGNNLGVVTTSVYINDPSTLRKDSFNAYYLDRNLTITPAVQPSSAVDIRLYVKGWEFDHLHFTTGSGISSVSDLTIFKNQDPCSPSLVAKALPVVTTSTTWGVNDVVAAASISSFSSFYFSSVVNTFLALPLSILEFNGRLVNNTAVLNWKTTNEYNAAVVEVQRSIDGGSFASVGSVPSANTPGDHNYSFTDGGITKLNTKNLYYRLKQVDIDGKFNYSKIVQLGLNPSTAIRFYPNPVIDVATVSLSVAQSQTVQARVVDNTGRVVKQQTWNLAAGSSNALSVDVSNLEKGVYYLELKGKTVNLNKVFTKQ